MTATLATYSAHAVDISDGDAVSAMLELASALEPLGPQRMRVLRFEFVALDDAPSADVTTALFSDSEQAGLSDLRAVNSIALSIGAEHDSNVIRYQRDASPSRACVSVEPSGFRALEVRRQTAEARLQNATNRLNSHGNRGHEVQQEHSAAQAELTAATQAVKDRGTELARRMLVCVNAVHKFGLVRPSLNARGLEGDDGEATGVAEQIAALRMTISSQQRNAAEQARQLSAEYAERTNALRTEHEQRAARMQNEFEAREQRLELAIKARETEVQSKLDELSAREVGLELNDEKMERRKLRRELQEATKARAAKPDLSPEARGAFSRVVGAAGWTASISAALLLVSVGVPVYFANSFNESAQLLYLGWSLRALAGLTFGASLVYYIRALAERASLIADTEVRSRQFSFDVDRAQWLVEMALEYDKSAKPLSPELVAAFSRGLFEVESRSCSDNPGSLTDLLVNAEGLEVTLSKRGVRRALRRTPPVPDGGDNA